jgi:hypothetical protein
VSAPAPPRRLGATLTRLDGVLDELDAVLRPA